jgi:hypothetical protein
MNGCLLIRIVDHRTRKVAANKLNQKLAFFREFISAAVARGTRLKNVGDNTDSSRASASIAFAIEFQKLAPISIVLIVHPHYPYNGGSDRILGSESGLAGSHIYRSNNNARPARPLFKMHHYQTPGSDTICRKF